MSAFGFDRGRGLVLAVVLALSAFWGLAGCGGQDVATNGGQSPSSGGAATGEVTNIVWEWELLTVQPSGDVTIVPDPAAYTLLLREDGTFSARADCNQVSGTYSTASGYSFTLGPMTTAACGEDSLDREYLDLLSSVAAGGPDGAGGFALETAGGEQRMSFRNGGAG